MGLAEISLKNQRKLKNTWVLPVVSSTPVPHRPPATAEVEVVGQVGPAPGEPPWRPRAADRSVLRVGQAQEPPPPRPAADLPRADEDGSGRAGIPRPGVRGRGVGKRNGPIPSVQRSHRRSLALPSLRLAGRF